jgi:uncharacterized protein YeaO (DUF488 family)
LQIPVAASKITAVCQFSTISVSQEQQMSDSSEKQQNSDNTKEKEKVRKKKVWMPKKEGGFKSVMRTVPERPSEPEPEPEPERDLREFKKREFDRQDTRKRPERDFRDQRERRPAKPVEMPEAEPKPAIPVEHLYTLGMQRSNPQRMMQVLADTGVSVLIDVRSESAMFAPGFVKPRDLAILLKESVNIEYRREEILVPSGEITSQFERDGNESRFRQAYLHQLQRNRASELLDRSQFAKKKVVLLGDKRDSDKDLRGILANYLETEWNITTVHHLR